MYAELHCKTNFTFLTGASHADELVTTAKLLGYHSLAVTDINTVSGVVRAHAAAKDAGLPIVIGCEFQPTDAPPAALWVPNMTAYRRMSRLITVGRRRTIKGQCELTFSDLAEHSEELFCGVLPTEDQLRAPEESDLIATSLVTEPGWLLHSLAAEMTMGDWHNTVDCPS